MVEYNLNRDGVVPKRPVTSVTPKITGTEHKK